MFKCTIHRNGWQLRKKFPQTSRSWSSPSVGGDWMGGDFNMKIWRKGTNTMTDEEWIEFLRLVLGAETDSRPWGYGCEGMWGGTSSVLLLLKQNWHARPRLGERWTVELKAFFQRRTTAFKFNNICKSQTITLYLWEWNANIILTKIVYLSFHLSICNE